MASVASLYELASSYWASSTLQTAVDLGIFPFLTGQPRTGAFLAEHCDCDPGSLTALLDACAGLGILIKHEDGYELPEQHRPYLDPDSPDSLVGAFTFNRDLKGLWDGLTQSVQRGEPVLPSSPHLGSDPARTRRFVEGMHSRAALMTRGLLQVVKPEPESRILDLAGGPGTFSLRLAEKEPGLQITVFDLPTVVEAARDIHQDHPCLSQVIFQGGDYHADGLPDGFDLILYCGALHQEPPEKVPELLLKCKTALASGGKLMIVDLLLDPDRTTPVYSALFDLNMRLMKPGTHVHAVEKVEQALADAGFKVLQTGDVPETPYRFVEASIQSFART